MKRSKARARLTQAALRAARVAAHTAAGALATETLLSRVDLRKVASAAVLAAASAFLSDIGKAD